MKYATVINGFVVLFAACTDAQQNLARDEQALTAQGAELASQFVGTLLPTLQQAIQAGGLVNGIEICAVQAPAQINKAEVVAGEFRYMQAQAAGPLCLTCHGTEIPSEVSEALARLYPDDMATGYLAGQIRGAISLRAPN